MKKLKLDSLGNIITLCVFTLLPIILFASILVLKLRENYLQEIEHLKTNNMQGFQSLNMCLSDLTSRESSVNTLHEEQHLCRLTMAKVSETVDSLSRALQEQVEKHMETKSKMMEQSGQLESEKIDKDNTTLTLKAENLNLSNRVLELTQLVDNLTLAKSDLEGRLGSVMSHVDTLKSNTNRLEGEKKGLEKVLVVKEALQTIATSNGTSAEEEEEKDHPPQDEGDKSIKKILKGLETSPLLSQSENSGDKEKSDPLVAVGATSPTNTLINQTSGGIGGEITGNNETAAVVVGTTKVQELQKIPPLSPPSMNATTNSAAIAAAAAVPNNKTTTNDESQQALKPISKILKHLEASPLLGTGEVESKVSKDNE